MEIYHFYSRFHEIMIFLKLHWMAYCLHGFDGIMTHMILVLVNVMHTFA